MPPLISKQRHQSTKADKAVMFDPQLAVDDGPKWKHFSDFHRRSNPNPNSPSTTSLVSFDPYMNQ
jgi:hypothetical protein